MMAYNGPRCKNGQHHEWFLNVEQPSEELLIYPIFSTLHDTLEPLPIIR